MYMCVGWSDKGPLRVETTPATVFEDRGEGYKDYPDPDTRWLRLDCGSDVISVRLTGPQMAALYWQLSHALQDMGQQAALADVVEAGGAGEGPDVGAPPEGATHGG